MVNPVGDTLTRSQAARRQRVIATRHTPWLR
jgi:hypothetical protein